MTKFCFNKFLSFLSVFLIFNPSYMPANASSSLAAWTLKSNGILELRTKSNSKLKAYFQKSDRIYGDRFWIDFKGELINPRIIKGNGPIKEIRLGKPIKGQTRMVIEFNSSNGFKPLKWRLIGIDENRWRIKFASFPKKSFQAMGEGNIKRSSNKKRVIKNPIKAKRRDPTFLRLPKIIQNKYYVVIDPGHGGPDVGAIGIGGIKESDVVLDVSRTVSKLLKEKGVKVRMTRNKEIDLDLPPRVAMANRTRADLFVSIHANASRGKRKDVNGLETFYYSGWRGRLLAEKIQKQILKVSPGSPDRGVRRGRYFVIKQTKMPAVLVEIGFLTGRLDARRLEKTIHRKRVAYAIAKGILEYLLKVG